MKKYLVSLLFASLLLVQAVALAYNPGQRTMQLLGQSLNSDKHPVHLVVEQKVDLANVLTAEAYEALEPAKRFRVNRTEYHEANGVYSEVSRSYDGEGKLVKHTVSYVKGGYWYTIDHVNKIYDRIPELPGMRVSFVDNMVSWFANKPQAGFDEALGWDYDKLTKGDKELLFYYDKEGTTWQAYAVGTLPMFKVLEYNEAVAEEAFALPPADYQKFLNERMRNFANRLMGAR